MTTASATDGEALLAAILAEPDADDLRLIYADFLEETGQPERAEFVRCQRRIATLEAASGHAKTTPLAFSCKCAVCVEAFPLRRRERELLGRWCVDWVAPLDRRAISGVSGCDVHFFGGWRLHFRRGLVEAARCALDAWREHGPALVRAHPVRRVELTDRTPSLTTDDGWRWYLSEGVPSSDRPDELPDTLFDLAHRGKAGGLPWDCRQDAEDALSDALILWAKAGCP